MEIVKRYTRYDFMFVCFPKSKTQMNGKPNQKRLTKKKDIKSHLFDSKTIVTLFDV